jgi:general secretion pathway protein C
MAPRLFVLVIGFGILGSTLFWVFIARQATTQQVVTGPATLVRPPAADADWARLLGATAVSNAPAAPAVEEADPGLRLVGVMASGSQGLALIATADSPARVFRVGAAVQGDIVVKSVSAREVRLGPRDGPASSVLVLPTAPPAGGQPMRQVSADAALPPDSANDTSPIVPPHIDMATPRAAESGTPGSNWSELRAQRVTP